MIQIFIIFTILYAILILFLVYVSMCGMNKFHRNGIIGSIYRFLNFKLQNYISKFFIKICPCCSKFTQKKDEDHECMGPKGKCRYFIAIFFYVIYMIFCISFFSCCYPNLEKIHPNTYKFHKFFSLFVLPWPWVIFIYLQFADPGEITDENVESYLKIYPYDNVIYYPALCPTLKIPVVPRSRYCKYTNKRVAYVF